MKVHMGGFLPLKPGKIHLRCATCGRKRSNQTRPADAPINAVLKEFECARHGPSSEIWYFDEQGIEIK